jgi:hypothetical protein
MRDLPQPRRTTHLEYRSLAGQGLEETQNWRRRVASGKISSVWNSLCGTVFQNEMDVFRGAGVSLAVVVTQIAPPGQSTDETPAPRDFCRG